MDSYDITHDMLIYIYILMNVLSSCRVICISRLLIRSCYCKIMMLWWLYLLTAEMCFNESKESHLFTWQQSVPSVQIINEVCMCHVTHHPRSVTIFRQLIRTRNCGTGSDNSATFNKSVTVKFNICFHIAKIIHYVWAVSMLH